MKINKIELQNFRGFASFEAELADQFNLVVGDNGKGKTSLVEALAIGAGSILYGLPPHIDPRPGRTIQADDVNVRPILHGRTFSFEPQYPCKVHCTGIYGRESGEWHHVISVKGSKEFLNSSGIAQWASSLFNAVSNGTANASLPLVCSYGTGRLWMSKGTSNFSVEPGSRLLGYLNCLHPTSDEELLFKWMMAREFESLQRQEKIGVYEAVKKAIVDCVENAKDVRYDASMNEPILTFNSGEEMSFYKLSDGYRNMLAMVADIANRMAILNPHLMENATTETPGIVLIDEIDLHLHPKWQRHVVGDLMRTFPKVQFVATTHSPFIIQSLPPEPGVKLLNLDDPSKDDFAEKSIEDIAEEIQDVENPQRSERFQKMVAAAEEYYHVLQQAKTAPPEQLQFLRDKLDALTAPYGENPAYIAFLKTQRLAAKIDEGQPA